MYAGRAGTGMAVAELERVWQRLQPLAVDKMPLAVPPPRSRFGSLLVLSRVHWVRPEMVVEVSYVECPPDGRLSGSADRAPGGGVGGRCRSRFPAGLAGYVRRPRRAT